MDKISVILIIRGEDINYMPGGANILNTALLTTHGFLFTEYAKAGTSKTRSFASEVLTHVHIGRATRYTFSERSSFGSVSLSQTSNISPIPVHVCVCVCVCMVYAAAAAVKVLCEEYRSRSADGGIGATPSGEL